MKKLIINIENCYGISKLEYTFDFEKSKVYSIYAPNGVMKTSFSKTFSDLSKNKESKDLVFHDRLSKREIVCDNGVEINGENLFVIEPYNKEYSSEKESLLLVNQDIKRQYDAALLKIEKKKKLLFDELKRISGLNGRIITPENELLKVFNKNSIFEVLEEVEDVIGHTLDKRLSEINYGVLFNKKTIEFLESGQITLQLNEYIDKYNELLDKSDVLSKSFNHYHANEVLNNLTDNGFFKANHSVKLFNGIEKEEINTAKHLEERIAEEKKKILSDKSLLKKFDAIDKKLRNVELRNFRDCLFENQDIISRLSDYNKLQKDIWLAYFSSQYELFLDFIKEYKQGRDVIQNAITTAKNEKTKWIEVVNLFNRRFSPVPFNIEISNQEDVILKDSSPKLLFNFLEKGSNPKAISRDTLLTVLSQGEKRTLYILNILFEINARKNDGIKTLFVFDDIADSFDYKNKYANS
jgi:hypothetical protein